MKAGEIWWVELPLTHGHGQSGRRPAIVVQPDRDVHFPTVLVVPLTSQIAALRFDGTALIEPGSNGLHLPSVALAFQMTVVDRRFFSGRLGALSAEEYASVWNAFDAVTQRVL